MPDLPHNQGCWTRNIHLDSRLLPSATLFGSKAVPKTCGVGTKRALLRPLSVPKHYTLLVERPAF